MIAESKTILWNGPVGVFEIDNFAKGSRALAEAIVEATKKGAFSLIGGGDSVACHQQVRPGRPGQLRLDGRRRAARIHGRHRAPGRGGYPQAAPVPVSCYPPAVLDARTAACSYSAANPRPRKGPDGKYHPDQLYAIMRLHIKAYRDSLGAYERETGHKKTNQPTGFYSLDKVGSMPPSAGTNPQRRITAAGDRPMRRPESGMARCIRFRTKKRIRSGGPAEAIFHGKRPPAKDRAAGCFPAARQTLHRRDPALLARDLMIEATIAGSEAVEDIMPIALARSVALFRPPASSERRSGTRGSTAGYRFQRNPPRVEATFPFMYTINGRRRAVCF